MNVTLNLTSKWYHALTFYQFDVWFLLNFSGVLWNCLGVGFGMVSILCLLRLALPRFVKSAGKMSLLSNKNHINQIFGSHFIQTLTNQNQYCLNFQNLASWKMWYCLCLKYQIGPLSLFLLLQTLYELPTWHHSVLN